MIWVSVWNVTSSRSKDPKIWVIWNILEYSVKEDNSSAQHLSPEQLVHVMGSFDETSKAINNIDEMKRNTFVQK